MDVPSESPCTLDVGIHASDGPVKGAARTAQRQIKTFELVLIFDATQVLRTISHSLHRRCVCVVFLLDNKVLHTLLSR